MSKQNFKSVLLDLLFPPKCPFCCKLLSEYEIDFCNNCQKELPWLVGSEAEQSIEFISKCVSPLRFQNEVRESMHRFKFGDKSMYASVYGRLMAQCVLDNLSNQYDVVCWVPISKKGYRKRGYMQTKLLAETIAKHLNCESVNALYKIKETVQQSTISDHSKRRANVLGAFQVIAPEMINGKRVLLVDDVVTSGATLSECARTLRTSGAKEVFGVTLCRAIKI